MIGVIPAAGVGKRMQPLSIRTPKPLLPVLNQPIIEYSMERLRMAGIDEIYIVVGYRKDDFKYLRDVKFVEQYVRDGALSAIKKVEKYVDEDFIVIWGDNFFRGELNNLIDLHTTKNPIATVMLDREKSSGAKIFLKNGKIWRFEERPGASGGYCPAGVYAFSSEVFNYIEMVERSESGEYEISDMLQLLVNDSKVEYVWLNGWRMNITTPVDLLKANLRALDEIGENLLCGERCVINGKVSRSVIGNEAKVENSTVTCSLLLDGSIIMNCCLHSTVVDKYRVLDGVVSSNKVIG
jgi:NDP-sugar pyrophosphorylase family protein